MGDFGARPHFPTYAGGGDLWEEPVREREWWETEWLLPALFAVAWGFIGLTFFFVGLTFWLAE